MSEQSTVRTRDRVFRAVRERLISGAHKPGEKIKIRPLAEVLGTSMTPVREALLQLVVAGALQHDPQHSIRVPVLTGEEYSELIHLRILLECELAGVAAQRITAPELEKLESLALGLLEVSHETTLVAEFHFGLYRAAHMPLAIPLIEGLWLRTGPYLHLFKEPTDLSWGRRLRGDILRGLRTRDSRLVRQALKNDLSLAREFVVNAIGSKSGAKKPGQRNESDQESAYEA